MSAAGNPLLFRFECFHPLSSTSCWWDCFVRTFYCLAQSPVGLFWFAFPALRLDGTYVYLYILFLMIWVNAIQILIVLLHWIYLLFKAFLQSTKALYYLSDMEPHTACITWCSPFGFNPPPLFSDYCLLY